MPESTGAICAIPIWRTTNFRATDWCFTEALRDTGNGFEAILQLNIGGIKHVQTVLPVSGNRGRLRIVADNLHYHFYFGEEALGSGQTKYLTSEVSGGFTGVIAALYAVGENTAVFENFSLEYKSEA